MPSTMFVAAAPETAVDWKAHTCVVPTVGIGNVAPLAVDLLVATLGMKRIGYMDHDGLLAMAGSSTDPGAADLTTSMEVYHHAEKALVVLQQRAPVSKAFRGQFRQDLAEWLAGCAFQRVVLLAGADTAERLASQIEGPQQRYLASPGLQGQTAELDAAMPCLEPRLKSPGNPDGIYIHRGGIARLLFASLCEHGIPAACLVQFCAAGDTRREAGELVMALNAWLKFTDGALRQPHSWELCYGTGLAQNGLF